MASTQIQKRTNNAFQRILAGKGTEKDIQLVQEAIDALPLEGEFLVRVYIPQEDADVPGFKRKLNKIIKRYDMRAAKEAESNENK